MLAHTAYDFPHELVQGFVHKLTPNELVALDTASLDVKLVTDEKKIAAVFGCSPIGYLSNDALTWILLPKGLSLSRGSIRKAKKLFVNWEASVPWTLYAEVERDDVPAHSLALFMNFVPVQTNSHLTYYKYEEK